MSYEIPESIFAEFNIVEKMILGKKHFGVQQVFRFGKLKLTVMRKVYDGIGDNQKIQSFMGTTGWSKRWHLNEQVIKSAIRNDRSCRIEKYIAKHVN